MEVDGEVLIFSETTAAALANVAYVCDIAMGGETTFDPFASVNLDCQAAMVIEATAQAVADVVHDCVLLLNAEATMQLHSYLRYGHAFACLTDLDEEPFPVTMQYVNNGWVAAITICRHLEEFASVPDEPENLPDTQPPEYIQKRKPAPQKMMVVQGAVVPNISVRRPKKS